MDYKKRHPLESITNSQSLSMLEALIPFVDYPLKLPIALIIKYYEITQIMRVFQSAESISRYGLHNINDDPMDMLCALAGIPPDIMKMMPAFGASPADNDSFNQKIQSIFSEYDMTQKRKEQNYDI